MPPIASANWRISMRGRIFVRLLLFFCGSDERLKTGETLKRMIDERWMGTWHDWCLLWMSYLKLQFLIKLVYKSTWSRSTTKLRADLVAYFDEIWPEDLTWRPRAQFRTEGLIESQIVIKSAQTCLCIYNMYNNFEGAGSEGAEPPITEYLMKQMKLLDLWEFSVRVK